MARDLTYNNPGYDVSGANTPTQELDNRNPFLGPDDDDSSVLEDQYQEEVLARPQNQLYGSRPFQAYNGYYSSHNGTTQNLLQESSSEDSPLQRNPSSNSLDANSISVPPAYDRYPTMGGTTPRIGSSGGSVSSGPKANQKSFEDENPFASEHDFSPFGGYPAQSFPLHIDEKEPDDYLHNPDPIEDALYDKHRFLNDLKHLDKRSLGGLLGVIFLLVAAVAIFIVLPVLTYSGVTSPYKPETYEILTHYKYPLLSAIRTDLVDPDTPSDAKTYKNSKGKEWKLVFSDEFAVEGRTFYEQDDQFFTAPDLHYAATVDLEWYSPDAVTTENGTLTLTMDAYKNHDLFYRSGMVQSWNKLCFTQGLILMSARLPNYGSVSGLWPGLWTMGNLGRPGYMASTEGVWPYTYDSCDAGITANQSSPDGISYLPGQRLNACTCSGEDHPNQGTGRGAPEIDIIEAETDTSKMMGVASQSYQIAPMDIWYIPDYNFIEIKDKDITTMNTYTGGPFQQAVSGTTTLNSKWYEKSTDKSYQVYGYEYMNDNDDGYLTWYVGEPTLTMHSWALAPNGNVGWRRISKEPMSIIMNMGLSNNWAFIDWTAINFPVKMSIDYVRLYQPEDEINVTCDPDDYPTYDYIENHYNAYQNVNLTSWDDAGYKFPKNKLVNSC